MLGVRELVGCIRKWFHALPYCIHSSLAASHGGGVLQSKDSMDESRRILGFGAGILGFGARNPRILTVPGFRIRCAAPPRESWDSEIPGFAGIES